MAVKVADYIKSITPYKPGKPMSEVERELGLERTVKLASNENPLGPSPKVVEAIIKNAEEVNLYPDGNAFYLKNRIAEYHKDHDVQFDEIVVGNGSNEVIELAIKALVAPGEELIISEQAFIVYELISKANNIKTHLIPQKEGHIFDIDGYIEKINENTKLICLVNPNNPTGTYYDKADFEKLLKAVPEGAVVLLDEAYFDFVDAEDYPSAIDYRKDFSDMIICRTFSKAFGMSGLRLGYAITTVEIADYINRVREPFNTNLLAQAAGIAALGDMEYLGRAVAVNREGKGYYYKEFDRLGLEYLPTQTNFILVKVGESPDAGKKCFDALLKKGVIIRPMAGYKLPEWVRISIGLPEENMLCIKELENYLNS